ncbi:hypothetical protein N7478_007969 [Penicillium angulare]|uniref:uncharacterized protein n=1 Tax=Penicillium angulare TaxID=116970 RepID=UPI0025420ADE|nr:uncharacterized protein N7478_007969 [Penicillium angulare]KAJ5272844.1 hypothetical protein N7478_007969 [Penicillium angulare]
MKFHFAAILALLPLALAAKSLKSVIVTFPKGTPSGVVQQAKDSLVAAMLFFSGFAAEAPVNALQTLSTASTQYKPEIEEDKVVTINGEFEGSKHSF